MKLPQLISINKFILNIMLALGVLAVISYIFAYWSNSFTISSDNLYGPRVVNNIIYEHGHITNWLFSRMPNFFPDLLLTFIIGLFTHNVIANVTIFGLIQTLWLIFIVPASLTLITRNLINFYMGALCTLSLLLLSNEWSNPLYLQLLGTMLYYSWHFGALLTGLTSLCLLILTCRYKNNYLAVLFYLFTTVSIASNLIVAFYFTIPLLFTFIYCRIFKLIPRKHCLQLIFLLVITNLSGYLLYEFCPLLYLRTGIQFRFGNFHHFLKVIINFFHQSPAMAILWFSFLLFAPLSLIKNRYLDWVNVIILWLLVMSVVMVPVFIFTDESIAYNELSLRHLQPLILLPIFIGLPLLIYKHTNLCKLLLKKSVCAVCFILVIIASFNQPKLNFTIFRTDYPPEVACLDNYAHQFHLHAGLGDYWQATYFTVLNHANIKVVSIANDFQPHLWLTSPKIYNEKNQYDFIIIRSPTQSFDPQQVVKRFGQPTATFSCPGNYEYFVYQNGAIANPFPVRSAAPPAFQSHFWPKTL